MTDGQTYLATASGLSAQRPHWRREAGNIIPGLGRIASVVSIAEDGERIPIFAARGSFRVNLNGRDFRFGHLGDAEAAAFGWLIHSGGRIGGR